MKFAKGRVIGAVSGGVDSTVVALAKLMHEAIGDRSFSGTKTISSCFIFLRFHAIMVDKCFLRFNEAEQGERNAQ